MYRQPNIHRRDPQKIATTSITNELADALNGLAPLLQTGQVDEQVYPAGGGGSIPVGQFTGQILTSIDNAAVWLLDVYVPALPS